MTASAVQSDTGTPVRRAPCSHAPPSLVEATSVRSTTLAVEAVQDGGAIGSGRGVSPQADIVMKTGPSARKSTSRLLMEPAYPKQPATPRISSYATRSRRRPSVPASGRSTAPSWRSLLLGLLRAGGSLSGGHVTAGPT